jgi:PilZ domain
LPTRLVRNTEVTVGITNIRGSLRVPLELPVQIRWKSAGGRTQRVEGKTSNISGNGLFMAIPRRLRPGARIAFTIMLPAEIAKIPIKLICRGRVVRQHKSNSLKGVAAIIDDYKLIPVKPRRRGRK